MSSAAPRLSPDRRAPRLVFAWLVLLVGGAVAWAEDPPPKDIKFDDIKLALKKDQAWDPALLTDGVKKLDGKQVRIRGYIFPTFRQTGIKEFVLMRDNMECCFGPGAALHDCIVVDMVGDATASYTVRPVTVTGEFAIRETPDLDGTTRAIYHLDSREVK